MQAYMREQKKKINKIYKINKINKIRNTTTCWGQISFDNFFFFFFFLAGRGFVQLLSTHIPYQSVASTGSVFFWEFVLPQQFVPHDH